MAHHAGDPQPLCTKDKEIYLFVMMIVLERWPLILVEKSNYRNNLNIENPFSTQLLIKVLLQMTVDIEGLISSEMILRLAEEYLCTTTGLNIRNTILDCLLCLIEK